ncbi:MAG TPA: hypothetical protein DCK87_03560 [Desulfotomaculum sp.]|nr:hypothetical protein [Desulfotomaculum sp.]
MKQLIQKDLVVLAADKNMEYTLKGLLLRHQSLGSRQLMVDFYTHPEHDPGCLLRGHDFLRSMTKSYAHALVVLDRDGCGQEKCSAQDLESQIENRLKFSGWDDRATAIAIEPELEIWVWSNSPHVDRIIGWSGKNPDLRTWLMREGFIRTRRAKPDQPKEAFEQALKIAGKARSSSLFHQIARSVSLEDCVNPAFKKLKDILKNWFPG